MMFLAGVACGVALTFGALGALVLFFAALDDRLERERNG